MSNAASITGKRQTLADSRETAEKEPDQPILQGLIGAGMGKGPALALLLAGPALSLPNMLVIRSVMGTEKTVAYVSLVVVMATISGLIYGHLYA